MSDFQSRLPDGLAFEAAVRSRLRELGWDNAEFGLGVLPDAVRKPIKQYLSPFRWLPDCVATRPQPDRPDVCLVGAFDGGLEPEDDPADVCLVDAKAGRSDTPNYAVEVSCCDAMLIWEQTFGFPTVFVLHDWRVVHPSTVRSLGCRRTLTRNGSGTPYYLIPKARCWLDFDKFFASENVASFRQRIASLRKLAGFTHCPPRPGKKPSVSGD